MKRWLVHLLVLTGLGTAFWPLLVRAIQVLRLPGNDSDQFIFFAQYYSRYFVWPPGGWDHMWYQGAPRVLDMTFLHFYLIQPFLRWFGLNLGTNYYVLFWLGVYFFFSYLLFNHLSRSRLIGAVFTLVLMYSPSTYLPIYRGGVVLSGLAQMVMPAILYFLVVFGETGKRQWLIFGAVVLAWQYYSHGPIALFFGLISAGILFLCRKDIKNGIKFGLIALAIGALAIGPPLISSLGGGYYSDAFAGANRPQPGLLPLLWGYSHPALALALALSLALAIMVKSLPTKKFLLPFGLMVGYIVLFLTAKRFGLNPVGDYLFAERVFWYFGLTALAAAAVLLSGVKWPVKLGVAGVLVVLVWLVPLDTTRIFPGDGYKLRDKNYRDEAMYRFYRQNLDNIWEHLDQSDTNHRVWLDSFQKIFFNIISDTPLVQGWFHFHTNYSRPWSGLLYAAISQRAKDMNTLPDDVARRQAEFLLDWYAIRYFAVKGDDPEFNVVSRYWDSDEYIATKSAAWPPALLEIKDEYRTGIVEAVRVPVVGLVGQDSGYDSFLRDLAILGYDTEYLIPLRLGGSIDKLSHEALAAVDLLILNDWQGSRWEKISRFVSAGGRLWIETGGKSGYNQAKNLPLLFPGRELAFNALGENWQAQTDPLLAAVDLSQLGPLLYKGSPWKLSYLASEPNEGVRVVLRQAGKPVITVADLGRGRVLWSGVNIWYRPMAYLENSVRELQLVDRLLGELIEIKKTPPVEAELNRPFSESIEVSGSGIRGVVVKENFLPGWTGKVNGRRLAVYPAGTDFMYWPIPEKFWQEQEMIKIHYRGPLIYWLLMYLSIGATLLALEEIFNRGRIRRRLLGKGFNWSRVRRWWDKDEL